MAKLYPNLSNRIYHKINALSATGLKLLDKSPAHYKYACENYKEPTPAMVFGSCLHMSVLEPEKYCQRVTHFNGRKQGKVWDEFQANNNGKIVLSDVDFKTASDMTTAIMEHEIAGPLVEEALTEESVLWTDATYGFLCKCRPDIRRPDLGIVADLKTCQDASPEGFSRACANFGYHMQATWYLNGINQACSERYEAFLFIAIEKEPPYMVAVYNAKEMLEAGRKKIRDLIAVYDYCRNTGDWYGYETDIMDIVLPKWAA